MRAHAKGNITELLCGFILLDTKIMFQKCPNVGCNNIYPPHTHCMAAFIIYVEVYYNIILLWQIEEEEKDRQRGGCAALHALYHKITKWRKIEDLLSCLLFPPAFHAAFYCVCSTHINNYMTERSQVIHTCTMQLALSPQCRQVVDHNVKKALKDYTPSSLFMSKGRWLLNLAPFSKNDIKQANRPQKY